MSTIRDIAARAGVSVSTASLALKADARVRPATRQRVLDAAKALDYHPSRAARSLSSGRSWSLHLVNALGGKGLSSSFFERFARGVHDVVHPQAYTLALTVLDDEDEALEVLKRLMRERWTDGVILMNVADHERLLTPILQHGFPHVLLGHSERAGVYSVDSDNVGIARDATLHLLTHQRGPVLFLNGLAQHAFVQERFDGYRQAHTERGVLVDEALLQVGLQSAADGRERTRRLLELGVNFSSVLASSDGVAVGAMRALQEAGQTVPGEVAVIGMNNDEVTEYTDPRLSSVELNADVLGREAAELLLASISGAPPERRLGTHRLVLRDSS